MPTYLNSRPGQSRRIIPPGYERVRWWHYVLASSPFWGLPLFFWLALKLGWL